MGMGRDKRKAYKERKLMAASKAVKTHKLADFNSLVIANNHDNDDFTDADWRAVARMMIRLNRLA